MSLRFMDSFDHYTNILQKWTTQNNASCSAAAARTGPQGLRITGSGGSDHATLTLDNQGTWIVGVAARVPVIPGASEALPRLLDSGTLQGFVSMLATGQLALHRGGTTVAVSTNSLLANVYYYIEFKHIIDNVAGLLEVRVDGAVWATFTGDTQETANPTANQIQLRDNQGNMDYDDLYILDGVDQSIADPNSPPNNDYWGDTQIECIVPNGAGAYTEFDNLVGAPTHWEACDEVPPDEDVSYIDTPTLNDRDTFAMGNLSVVSATIPGIQWLARARKTAAGAANIARMYRRVADHQGANIALQESYAYHREIMGGDPQAAGVWTVANINAAEFGVRAT